MILTKALIDSGYWELIWHAGSNVTDDLLHSNDVEPLLPELAREFPMFRAGDLLVSLREINAVFVMDHDSLAIKWMFTGALRQHDPDFFPDGTIVLFNNRDDNTKIVWDWVHEATPKHLVPEVLEGTRYPYTAAQVAAWPK